MKQYLYVFALSFVGSVHCIAQVGGNINYGQQGGNAKPEQNERAKRVLTREEMPPSSTSMFIDASILMNVKASEYVAAFALKQEGTTLDECLQKMDATVRKFTGDVKPLGIAAADIFVDFTSQNKIYGYEVVGDVAKEKLVGFELKKNIMIHYKDYSLLDKLVAAAAASQIFDLIKVDYVVKDTQSVQKRLVEEAARVIKQKAARYQQLFGTRLKPQPQIYAEKPSIYYPTEMYDSYVAYEAEDVSSNYYRQKFVVQNARKSRTFYFNALTPKGFDFVINPVVIEPVVQFTLYMKVKYEMEHAQIKVADGLVRKQLGR